MYSVEFNNVWKKFNKGEKVYALRDLIPQMTKRMFTPNKDALRQEEFWAVKDVSFKIKKGEVLGIIGPNGAGKSTILKLLSQIMKPTKGEFVAHGRLSALIEVTAGVHPDFTGRENIYFNAAILGMKKKDIDAKFDQIVDFSGIEEFIDTPVKRYSSGMTARLGFAIAAHVDPEILLVDEVLSVGDKTFQSKCTQKMMELMNSGVTIIFISHNIALVQELCSRVILLHHGEVLDDGDAKTVIPKYENLVLKIKEEELRKKLEKPATVEAAGHNPIGMLKDIQLFGRENIIKDKFDSEERIKLQVDYETNGEIVDPLFIYEVVRADGVVCCHATCMDDNFKIDVVHGAGSIEIDLGETRLAPGVYYTRVSLWDREHQNPYDIIKKGIFTIMADHQMADTSGIYRLKARWKMLR